MQQYIGAKIIQAEPLTKEDGQRGYKVVYPDGYTSWSPVAAFDEAYRPCNTMTFGLAIEALKKGKRVARTGWNSKGMWLILVAYSCSDTPEDHPHYHHHGVASVEGLPWVGMKTADNKFVPWIASQTDMLAEDWMIAESWTIAE